MLNHWRKLGVCAVLGGSLTQTGCSTHNRITHSPPCHGPTCDARSSAGLAHGRHGGHTSSGAQGGHCRDGACQSDGCQTGSCLQCGWLSSRLLGRFYRPSNAVPDTFPLGKVSEAWYYEMETNAEAVDFVIHDLDFVGQTTELTSDGKDHVMEIAARMRSAPFPVIVERFPNNADPELDQARRALIAQILTDFGNPDAQQRVVVSTSYGPGYVSGQAQRNYYRHTLNGGTVNNNNFGGGIGGGAGF